VGTGTAAYWYPLVTTGTVPNETSILELPSPYALADVRDVVFDQTADTIELTHRLYPPQQLIRYGNLRWTLRPKPFVPAIEPPGNINGSVGAAGTVTARYKFTSIDKDTKEESVPGDSSFAQAGSLLNGGASPIRVKCVGHGVLTNKLILVKTLAYVSGPINGVLEQALTSRVFVATKIDADNFDLNNTVGITYAGGYICSFVNISVAPTIAGAINGGGDSNIQPLTTAAHGLSTGDEIRVLAVVLTGATPNANLVAQLQGKTFLVHVIDATNLSFDDSDGIPYSGGYDIYFAPTALSLPSGKDTTAAIVNTLGWLVVPKARETWVYKESNGVFGFLGKASGASFKDNGQALDLDKTPPIYVNPFRKVGAYPAAVTSFGGREVYARTDLKPQSVFLSRAGNLNNFTTRSPLQDDDAIEQLFGGKEVNEIRYVLDARGRLLVMTAAGEYTLEGDADGTLVPGATRPVSQGGEGCAKIPPILVGDSVLFVQALGSQVRLLGNVPGTDRMQADDVSIFALHLFLGRTLLEWVYTPQPHSIVWAVRSDGVLLGLTLVPDQAVWGWHRHDFDGVVESVTSLPENGEDVLYLQIARPMLSGTRRFIERMPPRKAGDPTYNLANDAFFVDCGLSYTGAPATVISGLDHLAGKVVVALADGVKRGPFTVPSSAPFQITLPVAASVVHVGLPFVSDLKTLRLADPRSALRTQRALVNTATIDLEQSRGFSVGADSDKLAPWMPDKSLGATGLLTGAATVRLSTDWKRATVFLRQSDPLPVTVLGITPNAQTVGGTGPRV
jgi:hypothetical protein